MRVSDKNMINRTQFGQAESGDPGTRVYQYIPIEQERSRMQVAAYTATTP